ncbi:MAG: hypothetical protein ACREM3_22385 [Candidatus Rokuibacteriota bacterium]
MRRPAALLSAAFLLAFLVEISPHLVHHAFEPDHVGEECPFATAAERQPSVAEPVAELAPAAPASAALDPAPVVADLRYTPALPDARAPPPASA